MKKIQNKILIPMSFCLILILGLFLIFLYNSEKKYRLIETDDSIKQILDSRVAQIDALFTGFLDQAYYISILPEVERLDQVELPLFLRDLRINELITEVAVITTQEDLFLPDLCVYNDKLSDWEFFQAVLVRNEDRYISAFKTSQGNTVISVAVPVFDKETGRRTAVLNISLDIFDFSKGVSDEINIYGGKGYILSKKGTMITNENIDYVLTPLSEIEDRSYDNKILRIVSENEKGKIDYTDSSGKSFTTYFSRINTQPEWLLAIDVPKENIEEPVLRLLETLIIGILLVLLVLVTVIWSILRNVITKPVRTMTAMLKDIAGGGGDLTRRIELNASKKNGDEIAQMAEYFNTFIGSLNTMVFELKGVSEGSRTFGDSLAVNTEEISASSTEATATTRSIGEQMSLLSDRIEKSTGNIQSIQEQIRLVNDNIDSESTFIAESSSAITEMVSSIQNLTRISNEKKATIDELADHAAKQQQGCGKDGERDY